MHRDLCRRHFPRHFINVLLGVNTDRFAACLLLPLATIHAQEHRRLPEGGGAAVPGAAGPGRFQGHSFGTILGVLQGVAAPWLMLETLLLFTYT